MVLPTDKRHPLKKQLFEYNIRNWQLAKMLDKQPSYISQLLNGQITMTSEMEQKIQRAIDAVRREREQQAELAATSK
jgi:plasmid maintenance system antidote protein VapI